MTLPHDPHAIVRIEQPGLKDGQGIVTYDSWVTTGLIKSIDVELSTNQSSEARVQMFDPKFRVIDAFASASTKAVVRIYLGYGEDLGEPVFKGILTQLERSETDTTLVFYDMAYLMKTLKRSGYKNKKSDVEVISDLVTNERNKTPEGKVLEFEGPGGSLELEKSNVNTSDEKTDWDWMMEKARDAGLVIYVRHDKVFAKKPALTAGTPVMTIRNRKDFNLRRDWDFVYRTPENVDGKPKVIKHRRRGRNGKFLKGTSDESATGRDETIIKRDVGTPSKSKLSKRAQAQRDLEREFAFEGRLQIAMRPGAPRLDYARTIDVLGIGKLMSNKYICRSVGYRFAPGTLNIDLELYRDIKS